MIRAIVSDFDGTLAIEHRISDVVQGRIKKFIKKGGVFSIATGRAYVGVIESICHSIGLSEFQIVRAGSEIISTKNNKVVWGRYIPPYHVTNMLNYLESVPEIFFAAEEGTHTYTKGGVSHDEFGKGMMFKPFSELPNKFVPKIMLPPFHDPALILPLYDGLRVRFPELHIIRTSSTRGLGIDITDIGAGKHAALLAYARLAQIPREQILGVGDSYNDFPLLEACGYKVAMGNAQPELKAIADRVVSSVRDNGMLDVLAFAESQMAL